VREFEEVWRAPLSAEFVWRAPTTGGERRPQWADGP
jgi:hypothetical protein